MTPDAFIAKWASNTRNEAAASKEHFLDLCALLDVPTPNSDPTGATYAFEKGATKAAGGAGWADVWRRGCFGWEYKSRGGDLEKAHEQLLRYAGALENPPLLICSDMDRIIVRTNWTNEVSERQAFALDDLRNAAVRARLRQCWVEPSAWKPGTTRQALTEKAAASFAELARRLRDRGHEPHAVAHFMIRLVFCLFADDVGLLPPGLFESMLVQAARQPAEFAPFAAELFRAMKDRGGRVGFQSVQWFNGGLFDDDAALPLDGADIAELAQAAALDWAEIDPSIMGTLFERGLNPDKRSQFGAHYTSRDMIERLIDPVIRRPLLAEWAATREKISAALAQAEAAKGRRAVAKKARDAAEALLRGFLDRLRAFRVLDPACGSGNFLYLALLALKDIEHRASVEAEALGLQREFQQVGPEAVLGIELDPYAAELARVSVWIGHIQWARRHGFPPPSDPVLKPLATIECRDALLNDDGSPAAWPAADAIVSNPPFLGDKAMAGTLGADYTARVRNAYRGRVSGGADFVCFWFEKAREAIVSGASSFAGLVATNSIRGGANRRVLDRIAEDGTIVEAWSDEPWTLDGAAVRVSLVCFTRAAKPPHRLDGREVARINPDLTSAAADLTSARSLAENDHVAFNGIQKTGPFEVTGDTARAWLVAPTNPNGRANADVVRPWWNGLDVTRRPRDMWIVDFGIDEDETRVAHFIAPYAMLAEVVRPTRVGKREERTNRCWWLFQWPRPVMRNALADLPRFIVTAEVSKHRIFVWAPASICPDKNLIAIARDDDATFGILHSRFHEAWALRLGTWLGVGNDPRYTPSTTFETFPFPDGLTPDIPAATQATHPHAPAIAAAARALVEARDRWLNPPELVEIVPEVVPGFPDRILPRNAEAAAILKRRTLTALYNTRGTPEGAWLDHLHAALDAAVAAAYGWPATITTEDALARLLALNHARSTRPI